MNALMVKRTNSSTKCKQNRNNDLSEDVFREMLLQAEPLLMTGCDEFGLRKRFTNLSAETIGNFVRKAIAEGIIIKEEQFGTFILLKPSITESNASM